jgi:transcriptional regulator with XRE-family HTH domain
MTPVVELKRLNYGQARKLPVGGRIRWARVHRSLSHDTLAARANTSRSYLIRVEKGLHRPSLEMRARIAVATEYPLEFFDDDEEDDELRDLLAALMHGIARRVDEAVERKWLESELADTEEPRELLA